MIFIKQYGTKRSGTCYVSALLRFNFRGAAVIIHGLGGKHQEPADFRSCPDCSGALKAAIEADEVRVAIAMKNPYAWMQSWLRAHYKWSKSWHRRIDENRLGIVADLCHHWNRVNRLWMDVPVRYKMVVRHEDLLLDFQGTMAKVAETLNLTPRKPHYGNIKHAMTPNDTISHRKFDPQYYLEDKYLSDLGPEAAEVVTNTINWEFADQFDYRPLRVS